MTSESATKVVCAFIDAANAHDLDRLADVLADDFYLPIGDGRAPR